MIVDGNSPRRIRRHLERVASASDITLVHRGAAITGNEARNEAMRHVTTEYVCFLDNDTFVADGWLADLERSADETGAWLVVPAVLWGASRRWEIHYTGGSCHIADGREVAASRSTTRTCIAYRALWPSWRGDLTEYVETHCVLARVDALPHVGPFDEALGRRTRPFDARPAGQRPGWRDLARAVGRRALSVAEAQHPGRLALLSPTMERRMGQPVVPPVQRDVAADRPGDRRRLP